ncbi:ArsR/SmtB family transcription factor [Candidatus Uabimicrobium sp. HlEnr_7]|uniref:ArsR/SmtB family transcription factor n=1 Tax=Candidatus Uabimicrobium helgolandensis TaxID=3095367 RepID=UPI003557DD0C
MGRKPNNLDIVFSAVSDPTRRAILENLKKGKMCASDIAVPFQISLPAVSKHLKILESAKLIVREKQGRVHFFHLDAYPIREAIEWMNKYKEFWETQLDALENFFEEGD